MKICYLDAFSGISGDMTVGALVDAGADWNALENALQSLALGAEYHIAKTRRRGIAASKFSVQFEEQKSHRHLPHVEKIIASGQFGDRAKQNALAVFRKLGAAEAKSHSVAIEKVHFHEVGAVDSISDVVGACIALDLLGIEEVRNSDINVGSGTVETEHGLLPVPAPATTELLKHFSIYSAGPAAELTTPTGAALLATLTSGSGALPPVRLLAQGFGAGDKDFAEQANVLRVLIGETTEASETTVVTMLEANIDDTSPQVLGYAMERLFAAGALDVTMSPVFMKKNRPGTIFSVVAQPEQADLLTQILFSETTTLGVRTYRAERRVLARQFTEVKTAYGMIRVKYSDAGGFTPEYEDCRSAASDFGVPLRTVIAEASELFRKQQNHR